MPKDAQEDENPGCGSSCPTHDMPRSSLLIKLIITVLPRFCCDITLDANPPLRIMHPEHFSFLPLLFMEIILNLLQDSGIKREKNKKEGRKEGNKERKKKKGRERERGRERKKPNQTLGYQLIQASSGFTVAGRLTV